MASVSLDDDDELPSIVTSTGMVPGAEAMAAPRAPPVQGGPPRLTPRGLPVPLQGPPPPPPPPLDTLEFNSDTGSPAPGGEPSPGPLLAGRRAGSAGGSASSGAGLAHAATLLDELLTSASHAAAPVKVCYGYV